MTTRRDLIGQLAAVIDDIGVIAAPADVVQELSALCRIARLATAGASVSVARLDADALVFDAADGAGAEAIIGTRLPITRGIAGFVARTGQAMIVEQVGGDPRFARDVAERVGYVPESIVAAPIIDDRGEVLGVLSVLDRSRESTDSLAIASACAEHAAHILVRAALGIGLSTMVLRAIAAAMDQDGESRHRDLAAALRRVAGDVGAQSSDEAQRYELAAVLTELRGLSADARASATRILTELTRVASTSRRRR